MASITTSNQSIGQINSNTWIVQFVAETSVEPSIKFDLSTNHSRPINLIVGPNTYLRMKSEFAPVKNSNSEEIKIYSYNGGKELGRIEPGSNQMGTVTYPEIKYSLLSQIQLPDVPQPNSFYVIVIDSYPAYKSVEYSSVRDELVRQDTQLFNSRLKNFCYLATKTNTQVKLIVDQYADQVLSELIHSRFEKKYSKYSDEDIVEPYVDMIYSDENKISRCLSEIVFGRVFGGMQPEFSSIISPGDDWDIVDAFSTSISDSKSAHKLTIRGSGLAIGSNCSSLIGMILTSKSENVSRLTIRDINLDTQICDFELEKIPSHSDANKLERFIQLEQYVKTLGSLVTSIPICTSQPVDFKNKIKEHIRANSKFIELIEYSEFTDWEIKLESFDNIINGKICNLVKQAKSFLSHLRSHFVVEQKSEKGNSIFDRIPLRQENTVARRQVTGFQNHPDFETYDEFDYVNGVANRQISVFPNYPKN